jgi:Peptidase family M23
MGSVCKLIVAAAMFSIALQAAAGDGFLAVSWTPPKIINGSPCVFKVEFGNTVTAVTGRWQGHDLIFVSPAGGTTWYALGGVDVEAKPGEYKLQLEANFPDGSIARREQVVQVERANYPTETLHVPERYVKPDPNTLVRIEADRQLKHVAFAHEGQTEWSGNFRPPIGTSVSEGFGTRRTFNGKLASIHKGVDYHAAPGTPILAANSGEVVLARELFYEGNCVIIDHGLGFATIYMHLSRLEVSEGQKLEKGQEIGLSGATGRVTGPHLHIAVRWQGEYLDPTQLWTLPLPDLHSAAVAAKQLAPGT